MKSEEAKAKERKEGVYHYETLIRNCVKHIRESKKISAANKKAIFEFLDFTKAEGVSLGRQYKIAWVMKLNAEKAGFDLKKATRKDIQQFITTIRGLSISEWTKHDLVAVLKKFYKWDKKTSVTPELIAWVKMKNPRSSITSKDIITREELNKMIKSCLNQRDKALIATLYETAARPIELLTLTRHRLHRTSDGFEIEIVGSKTDYSNRKVVVIEFAPILDAWLTASPLQAEDDLVFCGLERTNRGKMLSNRAAWLGVKRAAKAAGLTKRIYPYLFRHSRITELDAKGMPLRLREKFSGHCPNSRMSGVYSHLNDEDATNAVRGIYFDEKQNEKEAASALLDLLLTPKTSRYLIRQALAEGKGKSLEKLQKTLFAQIPSAADALGKRKPQKAITQHKRRRKR